jgi:ribosome-associated toxin RatA of RatAB toxin-antitoxin module
MAVMQRSARVPYSALQMLTLVNDIEAYPEFLHWCRAARIEQSTGPIVEAALDIGIKGIHRTIRTQNTTETTDSRNGMKVRIDMLDGPLKRLHGAWTFRDVEAGASDVELSLEYEIHQTPFGMILRALFDEIANSQLQAFIKRAGAVYGAAPR